MSFFTGRTRNELTFAKSGSRTIVYTSMVPDLDLTAVFENVERLHSNAVARDCTRYIRNLALTGGLQICWTSPIQEVRFAVEELMTKQYGVQVQDGFQAARLVCGPEANPATIATVLSRLRAGFQVAMHLGLRSDQPMDAVHLQGGALKRHKHMLRHSVLNAPGMQRTPVGYYMVKHRRIAPAAVLENPHLPAHLREAAVRARWYLRDHAVLEVLLASGGRVTEVCEATWAGINEAGFDAGLRLHTKGQGRSPCKDVRLTPEAVTALLRYCVEERSAFDRLHLDFLAWAGHHAWTPTTYLRFLRSRNIAPGSVPLFLTQRSTPYTRHSFSKTWGKMRAHTSGLQIVMSPHHIRHWYVNRELDAITAEYGNNELQYVMALQQFVTRMGWQSWGVLATYDHRGVATKMLERHDKKFQHTLNVVRHPIDETMRLAAQHAGLIPPSGRLP